MCTAITFSHYGPPDVLTVTAADAPQPGPGQVRIRVRAVAVNLIDVKIRSGQTDEAESFYAGLGYTHQPVFMSAIVGEWLGNEANRG
jgi:NADPH:quinone reductase-like Zn-dependent oxidoreductase